MFTSRSMPRLGLFLLTLALPSSLYPLNYVPTEVQARWHLESNGLECRLHQFIPTFGQAVFTRRAGQMAVFHLDSYEAPVAEGSAYLIAKAPSWKAASFDVVLGQVETNSTNIPIEIEHPMSDRLLAHLQDGMSPMFVNWDWYASESPIEVGVSVVNFLPAYRDYQRCIIDLPELNFSELATSQIMFDTDLHALSEASKTRLDKVVQIIKADPTIQACNIDGYADDVGKSRYNMDLSRRRTDSVEAYLVSKGIDSGMIKARFHGEANWVAMPVDEKSRAENRRVTVRLEKTDLSMEP